MGWANNYHSPPKTKRVTVNALNKAELCEVGSKDLSVEVLASTGKCEENVVGINLFGEYTFRLTYSLQIWFPVLADFAFKILRKIFARV